MPDPLPPSTLLAPSALDEPRGWLGNTPLLDLDDPRLRLKAHSLTQLCKSDREKALAVYAFVKRLTLAKPIKLRHRTAREVLDAGQGDADDKATLLVALLRASGIPARLRYVELRGEMLRGLVPNMRRAGRPVAEIWLGQWLRTDTYIFDARYMAAARQRLKDRGLQRGYGIHVAGHSLWDGSGDAFVGSAAPEADPMVACELGVVNDPLELVCAKSGRCARALRALHWNVVAPAMDKVIRELRAEAAGGVPVPARRS